jgi:hypothetical protein
MERPGLLASLLASLLIATSHGVRAEQPSALDRIADALHDLIAERLRPRIS